MLWAMDEIIHKKVPELATMILKKQVPYMI